MSGIDVAAVYTEYHPLVRNWFGARLGSHQEHTAEDLTSTVFEKVCRAADRYEDRGLPIYPWIWQITRNVLIDWLRRQRETVSPEVVDSYRCVMDAGSDRHADILDVRALMPRLSTREQDVMTERYWLGYVPTEIAQRAGRTNQAVRADQCRAVNRLRRAVEGDAAWRRIA